MKGIILRSALCLWLLLWWVTSICPAQDQKIVLAREKTEAAQKALLEAEDELIAVYNRLEQEFNRIAGAKALSFVMALDKAWYDVYRELKVWREEQMKTAAALPRRKFVAHAKPLFEKAGMDEVLDLPEAIFSPFASQASDLVFIKLKNGEELKAGDLEDSLSEIVSSSIPFYLFWNTHLFIQIQEARSFSKAHAALEEAKVALDRLERPERYTSRGVMAPKGMVFAPGGVYTLGPNTGWPKPRRKLNIREFFIDIHEVTNKQYKEFLKSLNPRLYEEFVPFFWPKNKNMENIYPENKPNHPVIGVSWKAANEYAKWVGKRLPTEEEWEAAARGKERYAFPWGNDFRKNKCNSSDANINSTTEVGYYPEGVSPSGCLDMAGNAWEWTSTDQDGSTIKEQDENVRNMVIRDGDYKESTDRIRCDYRWMTPMDPYTSRRPEEKRIGFRCAMNVKKK